MPDLVVANSADSDIFFKINENNNAVVDYNGTVNMVYSAPSMKTRCPMVG
jgi:hypothetical protein